MDTFIKFDEDDIVPIELYSYENFLFDSKEDCLKYIDSCRCEFETLAFRYDNWDFEFDMSDNELIDDLGIERDQEDPDKALDELHHFFDDYRSRVDNLAKKYNITFKRIQKHIYGPRYVLTGTFSDMKQFANDYCDHLIDDMPGEALSDVVEESKIDIISGNKDLITADLNNKVNECITEDTKKKSNGKWVNKGAEGEHGEFRTKKEADAQRKAMFANGYKEDLNESNVSNFISELNSIIDRKKKYFSYQIDEIKKNLDILYADERPSEYDDPSQDDILKSISKEKSKLEEIKKQQQDFINNPENDTDIKICLKELNDAISSEDKNIQDLKDKLNYKDLNIFEKMKLKTDLNKAQKQCDTLSAEKAECDNILKNLGKNYELREDNKMSGFQFGKYANENDPLDDLTRVDVDIKNDDEVIDITDESPIDDQMFNEDLQSTFDCYVDDKLIGKVQGHDEQDAFFNMKSTYPDIDYESDVNISIIPEADDQALEEKLGDEITADSVTDITLEDAEYNWGSGYNEFIFDCKINGVPDKLHLTEDRYDDGSGFAIHSDNNDIWDSLSEKEALKLENKLQEAIIYGNYHKKIEEAEDIDELQDIHYELMDDENHYLNNVIQKLWSELDSRMSEFKEVTNEAVSENTNEDSDFKITDSAAYKKRLKNHIAFIKAGLANKFD